MSEMMRCAVLLCFLLGSCSGLKASSQAPDDEGGQIEAIQTEGGAVSAYLGSRRHHEAGIAAKLWEEADDLRQEAEDEALLSREEVSRMLDFTEEHLADMKALASRLAEDAQVFQRRDLHAGLALRIDGIRFVTVGAVAKMRESILNRTEDFVLSGRWYDDKRFMMKLAQLLNNIKDEVREVHKMTSGIGMRIRHWDPINPENMTVALALALDGITDNLEFMNKFMQIDAASLVDTNGRKACEHLAHMVTDSLQPAHTGLSNMTAALDRMSRVVPSVLHDDPRALHMMANGAHTLLNMAYTQHVVFNESAEIVMQKLMPMATTRFHCEPPKSRRMWRRSFTYKK